MNEKMTNKVYHYRSSQDNSLIDDKIPRIAQWNIHCTKRIMPLSVTKFFIPTLISILILFSVFSLTSTFISMHA